MQCCFQILVATVACLCHFNALNISPPQLENLSTISRRTAVGSGVTLLASSIVPRPALLPLSPTKAPANTFRLCLCRHGETEFNRLGLAQGRRIDADLNPTGEMQASALGVRLAVEPVDLVASSTLLRARRTADIVASAHAPMSSTTIATTASTTAIFPTRSSPTLPSARRLVLPELDEIDFGNLEGEANANARIAATLQEWARGNWEARVGADGESGADVAARVRLALQKLAAESTRSSTAASAMMSVRGSSSREEGGALGTTDTAAVVAVAHSTYIRVFLALACGLPLAACLALDQRNCCVNVLDVPLSMAELDLNSQSGNGALSSTPVKASKREDGAALTRGGAFDPATLRAVNEVGHLAPLGLVHNKHAAPVTVLQDVAASAACAYTQQRKPNNVAHIN